MELGPHWNLLQLVIKVNAMFIGLFVHFMVPLQGYKISSNTFYKTMSYNFHSEASEHCSAVRGRR